MLGLHCGMEPRGRQMIEPQQNNSLLDPSRHEFLDGHRDERRREFSIGRIKPNPAEPWARQPVFLEVVERRGFDGFVRNCAARRVEVDPTHATARQLDDPCWRVKFVSLHIARSLAMRGHPAGDRAKALGPDIADSWRHDVRERCLLSLR